MKNPSDLEALLKQIRPASQSGYSTAAITRKSQQQGLPFEFEDLVELWLDGKIYASRVIRTRAGYRPPVNCRWIHRYQSGFFGYDSALGAYQISDNTPNPINYSLEATFSFGSAAVCVAVAPDHNHFAVGCLNGTIHICNLKTGSIERTVQPCRKRTWTICYSPAGDFFVSGHQNGDLYIFDKDGNLIDSQETGDWVRSISFLPGGDQFITTHKVSLPDNPTIMYWEFAPLKKLSAYLHVSGIVWSAACLTDGTGFVSCGDDNKVTKYSFREDKVVWSEKKHKGTVIKLAMHPVGGVVASASWTGTVKLWDLDTGKDIRTIEAHAARVYDLSFSPSGTMLASGGKDGNIALWQLPHVAAICNIPANIGWIRGLEFVNEDTLISVGSQGICKVWRLFHRLPVPSHPKAYSNPVEVINDYRRTTDEDDE